MLAIFTSRSGQLKFAIESTQVTHVAENTSNQTNIYVVGRPEPIGVMGKFEDTLLRLGFNG